jgi:hypothetical protein
MKHKLEDQKVKKAQEDHLEEGKPQKPTKDTKKAKSQKEQERLKTGANAQNQHSP